MQPADSATKYCQASHTCSDGINNPFDFMERINLEEKPFDVGNEASFHSNVYMLGEVFA